MSTEARTPAQARPLGPGARLLLYVLRDRADGTGSVVLRSAELLEATGWTNRATVRKRSAELVRAGLVRVEPTTLPSGGRGPNRYTLRGT